jgi:putative ABC transport system ATP-binding protein
MSTSIDIRSVTKTYHRGGEALRVLDELDLQMDGGTFYALMGPSGSGKTTLLNLIGGLDHADSGEVLVGGEDLTQLDGGALAQWRAENVGFIFQGFNLLPVLSARENVELPLLLAPLSKRQRREQAERALELVGLKDRMGHKPRERSRARSPATRRSSSPTNRPATSIAPRPTACSSCCSASIANSTRRS